MVSFSQIDEMLDAFTLRITHQLDNVFVTELTQDEKIDTRWFLCYSFYTRKKQLKYIEGA